MYKGGTILHDVLDEQLVTNKISTMLINEGYKFSIADDALIDERLKYEKVKKSDWIPVSERSPTKEEFLKNDSRFIVTDGQRVYQSLYDMYEKQSFVEVYYKGNCNLLSMVDERIIAWQPLPEPYKE
jgi:hypothetical protein